MSIAGSRPNGYDANPLFRPFDAPRPDAGGTIEDVGDFELPDRAVWRAALDLGEANGRSHGEDRGFAGAKAIRGIQDSAVDLAERASGDNRTISDGIPHPERRRSNQAPRISIEATALGVTRWFMGIALSLAIFMGAVAMFRGALLDQDPKGERTARADITDRAVIVEGWRQLDQLSGEQGPPIWTGVKRKAGCDRAKDFAVDIACR